MMDALQIIGMAGNFVGSMAAAFLAQMALSRSKATEKSSAKVQTEMLGEGDDPSLRQMLLAQGKIIDEHVSSTSASFAAMHTDSSKVMERIDKLEQAVFMSIEGRVAKLEGMVFLGAVPAPKMPRARR